MVNRTGRSRRLLGLFAIAAALFLLCLVGLAASGLTLLHSSETNFGTHDNTVYLADWTETGSLAGTVPTPAPAVLSAVPGTPTVLPAAAHSYLIAAGTAGHQAAEFTFSEAVGIPRSLEIEILFQLKATVGAVTSQHTYTVFVETQAAAIGAAITFTIYWDGGAAAGVTLVSQYELSQACSAVGVCP